MAQACPELRRACAPALHTTAMPNHRCTSFFVPHPLTYCYLTYIYLSCIVPFGGGVTIWRIPQYLRPSRPLVTR